jgi:hypothetical protein
MLDATATPEYAGLSTAAMEAPCDLDKASAGTQEYTWLAKEALQAIDEAASDQRAIYDPVRGWRDTTEASM